MTLEMVPSEKWLGLDDRELVEGVEAIDRGQRRGEDHPIYCKFRESRAELSRRVWDAFSPDCFFGAGTIGATGISLKPLADDAAYAFERALSAAPPAPLTRQDFSTGMFHNNDAGIIRFLNGCNDYRSVTNEIRELVDSFLKAHAGEIDAICGHHWRVASMRAFYLRASVDLRGTRHMDGWPPSMKKLFILPGGSAPETGTTWVRLKSGQECFVDTHGPAWFMFENNLVQHEASPGTKMRPTIELDIVPSRDTIAGAVYAGTNGWYPWAPDSDGYKEMVRSAFATAVEFTRDLVLASDVGVASVPGKRHSVSRPASVVRSVIRRLKGVLTS